MIEVQLGGTAVDRRDAISSSPEQNALHWVAVYTRSRHEKCANEDLEKRGIETFLPLRKIKRHWSDRVKQVEEPLFKGYLFVHIPRQMHLEVLKARGIVRFVGHSRIQPTVIPDKELLSIRTFIEEEIDIDPYPYLKEGERVYIRSGPMKGVEGYIVRKDKHCRLVISLDLLMQSISVVIDEANVELV